MNELAAGLQVSGYINPLLGWFLMSLGLIGLLVSFWPGFSGRLLPGSMQRPTTTEALSAAIERQEWGRRLYRVTCEPSRDGDGAWFITLHRRHSGSQSFRCFIYRGRELVAGTPLFGQADKSVVVIHPATFKAEAPLEPGRYRLKWLGLVGDPPKFKRIARAKFSVE